MPYGPKEVPSVTTSPMAPTALRAASGSTDDRVKSERPASRIAAGLGNTPTAVSPLSCFALFWHKLSNSKAK